jgi:general secretion pathway protein J
MEILVSMSIIAMMMGLLWSSFALTARTKRQVEGIEARYHQIRLSMSRMAREISMAYLSKNDMVGTTQPRTFFVSQRNSIADDLSFSSLSHIPLNANAKECDQSVIRYYSAADPGSRSQQNLMRRETRRIGGEKPTEEGAAYMILEDIEGLHYEFYDEQNTQWKDTWNTKSADGQPDRLPTKVRISLTISDEQGRSITFITGTRIQLIDPLWFSSGT